MRVHRHSAVIALMGGLLAAVPSAPRAQVINLPPGFEVEPFASGLWEVTQMEWLPDGRMLVNEIITSSGTGRLRLIETDGTLVATPVYETTVDTCGLSGVALHPNFESNGQIFVWVSRPDNAMHELRRLEFDPASSMAVTEEVVFAIEAPDESIQSHCQTAHEFGPDGFLYLNLGDLDNEALPSPIDPPLAQDLTHLWGKVFRIDIDQPYPIDVGRPWEHIISLGHRNPFGMAVHPSLGTIYVTENGPADSDEINRILPGRNYGWPYVRGPVDLLAFEDPEITYAQPIAPVGCDFYTGDVYPEEYRDDLFFVDFLNGGFHHVSLSGTALENVDGDDLWFTDLAFDYLTHVQTGPDGLLYFAGEEAPFFPGGADTTIHRITFTPPPNSNTGVTTN